VKSGITSTNQTTLSLERNQATLPCFALIILHHTTPQVRIRMIHNPKLNIDMWGSSLGLILMKEVNATQEIMDSDYFVIAGFSFRMHTVADDWKK
jgi:hypothetical protein